MISPAPAPDSHQVVIAVEAAQITRAQLERHGHIPGSAAIGRVVAAGDQALTLLEQRVLIGSVDPCGQCDVCRRGGATVCPLASHRGSAGRGTLAERITVAGKWVVPIAGDLGLDKIVRAIDDGVDLTGAAQPRVERAALAVLAGDAALAYTAYARSDLAPKDPVVLLGRSPITRFLVEILLAKGLEPVVVVDRQAAPAWTAWLTSRGARVAEHDDSLAGLHRAVIAAMAGDTASVGGPSRPWKLLATEPTSLLRASELAGPRAIVTAIGPGPFSAVDPTAWNREVTILAVVAASPELIVETAALAIRGQLDVGAGTVLLEMDQLDPATLSAALSSADPTRSVVVKVPPLGQRA
jgi:hypothetical protein